jgi:hypothetical protein
MPGGIGVGAPGTALAGTGSGLLVHPPLPEDATSDHGGPDHARHQVARSKYGGRRCVVHRRAADGWPRAGGREL